MLAFAFALQLMAAVPAAGPAHASVHDLVLVAVQGLPADTTTRGRFLDAFRSELAAPELPTQRREADAWSAAGPLRNRFRLVEGELTDDDWSLDVTIGSPPALTVPSRKKGGNSRQLVTRRTSRGMIAAVRVASPASDLVGSVATDARFAFAYPPPASSSGQALGVPATGYVFSWEDAGRAVARLALETLHRRTGDLADRERADIQPAVRTETGR
jgi:hypothetical protein